MIQDRLLPTDDFFVFFFVFVDFLRRAPPVKFDFVVVRRRRRLPPVKDDTVDFLRLLLFLPPVWVLRATPVLRLRPPTKTVRRRLRVGLRPIEILRLRLVFTALPDDALLIGMA
jgi:hypothetical protein